VKHTIGLLGVSLLLLCGMLPVTAGENDYCFDWTVPASSGNIVVYAFVFFDQPPPYTEPVVGGYVTAITYFDDTLRSTYSWTPTRPESPLIADGRVESTIRVTMRFTPPDDRDIYTLGVSIQIDTNHVQETQRQRCDEMGSGDPDIVYPPDDRVNWQLGDDVAVIFSVNNSDNHPALHVYQPATDGVNPNRPLIITHADLPRPMPPAVDIWIAGEGLVNVYVLTTGEIQLNIGPTADGKVRVVIFPNFTGEGAYGYEYNFIDGDARLVETTASIQSAALGNDNPAQHFICSFLSNSHC
jgi:hypothetical protein